MQAALSRRTKYHKMRATINHDCIPLNASLRKQTSAGIFGMEVDDAEHVINAFRLSFFRVVKYSSRAFWGERRSFRLDAAY